MSSASATSSITSLWLSSARDGYCAATDGPGDCDFGTQGSWPLPGLQVGLWEWRTASEWCLAKCTSCRRCKFVTLSLRDLDCSWYHACDLERGLHHDLGAGRFKSGQVPRAKLIKAGANASESSWPMVTADFTEAALAEHTREVEQAVVHDSLSQWLRGHARTGSCGATTAHDAGDCTSGEYGSWELSACETRTWRSALAICIARCSACERCAYVSLTMFRQGADCSWYAPSVCDAAFIKMRPVNMAGVKKKSGWPRGTVTGRAQLPGDAWAVRAEHMPHTFRMAVPSREWHRATQAATVAWQTRAPPLVPPSSARGAKRLTRDARALDATRPQACGPKWPSVSMAANASGPQAHDGDAESRPLMGQRIACSRGAIKASGAWLAIGVMSGVASRTTRDAIRRTWLQWPAFVSEAVGCFMLARKAAPAERVALDEAAGRLPDVVWLEHATEGCAGMTFSKTLEFWRWAAQLPSAVTHVVKTEDDAVLVMPNLMATLRAWGHLRHTYLGGFAYAGYDLTRLKMCGFDWSGGGNFRRYGCRGYPAVPFAQGPLEAVSVGLARKIAHDAAIRALVEHATQWGGGGGRCEEDVLLGIWVAHLQARHPELGITHLALDLNDLADLHCGGNKNMLMSTPPRRSQLLVHRLKDTGGTEYVWDVLTCRVEHTQQLCKQRACRGQGNGACAAGV